MDKNKLINKYKDLRNRTILLFRKQHLKKGGIDLGYLDLFSDEIGVHNDFIDEDVSVVVAMGIKHSICFKTGNLDEAYCNLIDKIGSTCALNISSEEELKSVLKHVYETVINYFGYGDVEERINHYFKSRVGVTLESLKGKNLAVCLEDAVLSQNILKLLGFDSVLKVSLVQYDDGTYDTHAYNIINFNKKHYIFDSRFPSKSGPIVSVLNEEEYLSFVSKTKENEIIKADNNIFYFSDNHLLNEMTRKGRNL